MFCTNCGAVVEDDAAFCDNCGASLLDDAATPMQAPAQSYPVNDPSVSPVGQPQQPMQAQPTGQPVTPVQQAPIKKKSKAPLIITLVVFVVVIIGIMIAVAGGGGEGKETASDGKMHQIVFETSGGSQYKEASFETGTVIDTPAAPTRAGATFDGWYSDSACTEPVDFPYTIKASDPETITFYAKWTESAPAISSGGTTDYLNDSTSVFPLSSSTYLIESDLYGKSSDQLQRAINEIYARNGYIFQQSITEKQYFESRPWYRGTEVSQDVVKSRFNQFEDANMKLLQAYRDSHF